MTLSNARANVQPKAVLMPKATVRPAPIGLLQRRCACGGTPGPDGECAGCKARRLGLQRRATTSSAVVPPIVREVLRSPGQPLDAATRAFMEPRFGHDFSQVRVHSDTRAAESARAVNALAYTVGRDVVFGEGHYVPRAISGQRLLAHELAHVVQQSGSGTSVAAHSIVPADHESEREAESAMRHVLANQSASIRSTTVAGSIQRARGDLVAYSGGSSGTLRVVQSGQEIFSTSAVSGNPGAQEYMVGEGPIPTWNYLLHPQISHPTVTRLQNGICGANGISSGYQEISSDDPSPCSDPTNHYCTVDCPTTDDPGRKCFTPRDCWGEKRLKIEGSAKVAKPTGGFVTRSGFYIHGGNHAVAVTSGCIKVFDNAAFDSLRQLTGAVPLCVGAACPAPTITPSGRSTDNSGTGDDFRLADVDDEGAGPLAAEG